MFQRSGCLAKVIGNNSHASFELHFSKCLDVHTHSANRELEILAMGDKEVESSVSENALLYFASQRLMPRINVELMWNGTNFALLPI